MFADVAQGFKGDGTDRLDLPGKIVKALVVPASATLSRAESTSSRTSARAWAPSGLARARVADDGTWTQSPLAKSITPALREAINAATGAKPGDLLLFQLGPTSLVHTVMANLRLHLGKKLDLIPAYGTATTTGASCG
jgi:aspartyl-tRNA synthetase